MLRVIYAEARKLRRPTLALSTTAIVAGLSVLFTSLVYLRINSGHNSRRGEFISAAQLSQATGIGYGFKLVSAFLGLVALCIFASQTAQEYTYGTLRNLLVRQPARMKILAGKCVAMIVFAIFMVMVTAIITVAASYLLAPSAKVSTSAWATSAGLSYLGHTFFNVLLSTVGFGLFGMILGLLFRSPISAISVGVLWNLILENILSAALSGSAKWLPGQNISNIGEGGTIDLSYSRSLVMSAAYLVLGFAIVSTLFKKRDVAN
jgi:ABC-type transport system involved in multi-copper enzyme maturation permease subunit